MLAHAVGLETPMNADDPPIAADQFFEGSVHIEAMSFKAATSPIMMNKP